VIDDTTLLAQTLSETSMSPDCDNEFGKPGASAAAWLRVERSADRRINNPPTPPLSVRSRPNAVLRTICKRTLNFDVRRLAPRYKRPPRPAPSQRYRCRTRCAGSLACTLPCARAATRRVHAFEPLCRSTGAQWSANKRVQCMQCPGRWRAKALKRYTSPPPVHPRDCR